MNKTFQAILIATLVATTAWLVVACNTTPVSSDDATYTLTDIGSIYLPYLSDDRYLSFIDDKFVYNTEVGDSMYVADKNGHLTNSFVTIQADDLCPNLRQPFALFGDTVLASYDQGVIFEGSRNNRYIVPEDAKCGGDYLSACNAEAHDLEPCDLSYDKRDKKLLLAASVFNKGYKEGSKSSAGFPAAALMDSTYCVTVTVGKIPKVWFNRSPLQLWYRLFVSSLDTTNNRILVGKFTSPRFEIYDYNGKWLDSAKTGDWQKSFPDTIPLVAQAAYEANPHVMAFLPKKRLVYDLPVYWPKLKCYTRIVWTNTKGRSSGVLIFNQELKQVGFIPFGLKSHYSSITYDLSQNLIMCGKADDRGYRVTKFKFGMSLPDGI